MTRTPARAIFALMVSLFAPPNAHSQSPAAGASLSDQKAAFLALPDETRKAAQDALVWLGFYNGVVDGDFGKRTRDAILAFQASVRAPADGALSAATLQALLAAAQVARQAVGFHVIDDARTGARIGAPAKLLSGRVKLEFASSADPDLGALYARLTAETATRKIAYKAMKPDAFFVVRVRTAGRSSIRDSRRARPRPRRSAASPSSIRPRRAPCSTGSRSRSPIRSRRSLAKPPSPRRP